MLNRFGRTVLNRYNRAHRPHSFVSEFFLYVFYVNLFRLVEGVENEAPRVDVEECVLSVKLPFGSSSFVLSVQVRDLPPRINRGVGKVGKRNDRIWVLGVVILRGVAP
ncbi:hypothetical protein V8G54_023461 [Vigna mungo]|uniref:Uncharacterized protein n=1 Tax=Vigna mungo TaxID=3915 RepID=A0AAQ3N365_VIGMU